ncbi:mitochondrial coenzyme A diphosphatase NUDT8 [Archocentrus centrarchus]|uniref:mitochondrial coenzyme A diphosphatase NUDT8 n=1 Tax=Archocentrus centrarchus TaxID=63155 RepID=UPI0011EA389F|nr:nucleoside diphosphate-linked moiety X motif 8 [Archocentrus centrarchus]XP_030600571.1 nucleoside diphosphate-linked moiety X motif 8 [Archocentrus centrarchus]
MLRSHRILTWSCPIRSLQLQRDSHLSAFCDLTCAGWRGANHEKEISGTGNHEDGSSTETAYSSAPLSSFSFRDKQREAPLENVSKAILLSHHHQHHLSTKPKQVCDPVGTHGDCLTKITCLQRWRRPWEFCQPSLSHNSKTRSSLLLSHLSHRQDCVRPLSLSAHIPWIMTHTQNRLQLPSLHQTIATHQAAACVSDTWRDCLSPENEHRCRQCLGPNLKLYELQKGRKEGNQKWASILVSLCSLDGEPVFLFTLRSSTLKGRHKGDVSFAGGKSDPSDRDVVDTALREAREELGVNVGTEKVWGVLKPLRDVSGMVIAPVLAHLGPLEELNFKPNPGEVDEIFTLSLSHLCNPQNRGYTHFRTGDKYGYTLPVFRNGKHRVWGLTAVALDHTLKLIVPP